FKAQIDFGEHRQVRQIEPGIYSRAPRVSQRRWIVVAVHVAVDGQPVSQAGDTVGKIESRLTVARIAGITQPAAGIAQSAKIARQTVGSKGMEYTSPQGRTSEPDLQILGGADADFLEIKERPWRELMPGELGKQELSANLAHVPEDSG